MLIYLKQDLFEIPSGKLVELLKRAIKISIDHVLSCQLCSQKGFICEVCHDAKAIYPFDIETTHRVNQSFKFLKSILNQIFKTKYELKELLKYFKFEAICIMTFFIYVKLLDA